MTKPRTLSPFGFRLLFWETLPGWFPEASRSQPCYPLARDSGTGLTASIPTLSVRWIWKG